ncbi:hypothetical protein FF38_07436 [Lucilia cuprina]|uniref:Uncharacterized protein n=1 Tax=Lucilia cuprina TaxID=7375 RepID=A0A0L0BVH3_LUCCU|nr:hypothetical protein FF38_07436 [Lucilia cuprina]
MNQKRTKTKLSKIFFILFISDLQQSLFLSCVVVSCSSTQSRNFEDTSMKFVFFYLLKFNKLRKIIHMVTRAKPAGEPASQPRADVKDVTPISSFVESKTNGPPESPWQIENTGVSGMDAAETQANANASTPNTFMLMKDNTIIYNLKCFKLLKLSSK